MNKSIRVMCETAIFVALAVLLDWLFKMIPFLDMPAGGSLSIAMLPIILIGFRNGTKWGIIGGLCYAVINFFLDGRFWHLGSIFFDYIFAFGVLGLTGLFKKKGQKVGWYVFAIVFVCFLRYLCHSLSGVLFFASYAEDWFIENPNSFAVGSAFLYSFVIYNLPYMLASTVATVIIALGLYRFIYPKTNVNKAV